MIINLGALQYYQVRDREKSLRYEMQDEIPTPRAQRLVDRTDWLKSTAILLVVVDHIGLYFIDDAEWWRVVGRMAAPIFFFLIGFSHKKAVPALWLVLAVVLTVLESWREEWAWVPPNILLSFALLRIARPWMHKAATGTPVVFAVLVFGIAVSEPIAGNLVEYGATGWLWALFGLCAREVLDHGGDGQRSLRLAATGMVAVPLYVWVEHRIMGFDAPQTLAFATGAAVLCLLLNAFRPGPAKFQPPRPVAAVLQFAGRYTLEIYALQLIASEIASHFIV